MIKNFVFDIGNVILSGSPKDVLDTVDIDYKSKKMLEEIDQEQPAAIQLGYDFLHAEIIDAKDLQIGDTVYWIDCKNTVNTNHIVGHNSKGFYMDRYSNKYDVEPYDWNNNNYVKGKVRVERKKAEEV